MPRPIVMPSLGMYTAEGTLTTWLRASGAEVVAGEPLAEITTEKATYEIEAPAAGTLHVTAEVGSTVPVQGILGYVLAEGEVAPAATAAIDRADPGSVPAAPPGSPPTTPPPSGDIKASPVARRLASQHQIDLARVTGTGPGGRIVEADVLAAVAAKTEAPAGGEQWRIAQRIPLVGIRRTIVDRLRQSVATTLPVTIMRDTDVEALVAARRDLGARLERSVPYDALFVKVLATALRARPDFNAIIEQDAILVLDEINVGFAVAVPGGLVVPVVRDADARPLSDILAEMDALSARARANHVLPADVAGGTATISNLGGLDIDGFTPILNPPQAVILGIGRIRVQPVWADGTWQPRQQAVLSLTFDHRVADGAPAAHLLGDIARLLADDTYLNGLAGA